MEKKEHNQTQRNGTIHFILLHSYFIFLSAVILGVFFDTFLSYKLFTNPLYQTLGLLLIILGSLIIYWAQKTSGSYHPEKAKLKNRTYFDRGPYKYLRSPTHFGLFIMTLGLALILSSLFSIIFTILAHIFTKVYFLRKEESLLEIKYGEIYREYKRKVKNWI